jgi:hypothetical protein
MLLARECNNVSHICSQPMALGSYGGPRPGPTPDPPRTHPRAHPGPLRSHLLWDQGDGSAGDPVLCR